MNNKFTQFISTDHSKNNGTSKVKEYINKALENDIETLILCDQDNIDMAVSFYKECKSNKIKPIIGVNLRIEENEITPETDVVVIAKNNDGYQEIKRIISKSYLFGQSKLFKNNPYISKEDEIKNESYRKEKDILRPLIKLEWLNNLPSVVLNFGSNNDFLRLNNRKSRSIIKKLKDSINTDIILSVKCVGEKNENVINNNIINISKDNNLTCIINQNVKFSEKSLFETHEIKNAILSNKIFKNINYKNNATEYQYLMSTKEIENIFSDFDYLIDETNNFFKEFFIDIEIGNFHLPKFNVPIEYGNISESDYLKIISEEGIIKKLKIDFKNKWEEKKEEYLKRLYFELDVINKMGFPGYFLIVADFIFAAKDMGVPVGPGRGSGAGSLVAYGLNITDIDPIKYSLFFERFLNPERVSMPDFDIDFSKNVFKEKEKSQYLFEKYGIPLEQKYVGRDDVISYVGKKYNKKENDFVSVTQIITEGKFGGKGAIKDTARALNLSLSFVDNLIKDFKDDQGLTVDEMLKNDNLMKRYKNEPVVNLLINSAKKLEGRKKSSGIHAGGVVIAPDEIIKFSPIQCEPDGTKIITQFDKDYAEAVGLVKFDFLGLETLTVIDTTLKYIKDIKKIDLDIRNIPLDDIKSFNILKNGETKNIFQLESSGMRDLIKRLSPSDFVEISALVALYRPGPLESGMADKFVEGKFNSESINVLHEDLVEILQETYGTMIYQEQIQQAAQKLANYTLGAADELRRAMGKKKPEEMTRHKKIFIEKASLNYKNKIESDFYFNLKEIEKLKNIFDDSDQFITINNINYVEKILELINFNNKDFIENINTIDKKTFNIFWRSKIENFLLVKFNKKETLSILIGLENFITFNYIFSAIEKFAAYGFNKSHSVSYAMLTYQTLYLKANYPVEYMSSELTSNMDKTEKIGEIIEEVRRMKIKVLPPNINESRKEFYPEIYDGTLCIRYGLGAIKGLGEKELNKIILDKEKNGIYTSLDDFYKRIGITMNKKSKEVLCLSGSLDLFLNSYSRNDLLNELLTDISIKKQIININDEKLINNIKINTILNKIKNYKNEKLITKQDILLLKNLNIKFSKNICDSIGSFSSKEKLKNEFILLGSYITNHPLYINNNFREASKIGEIRKINEIHGEMEFVNIAGVIMCVREFVIKKPGKNLGKIIAKVTINDAFSQIDITIFPKEYDKYKDYLINGNVIVANVNSKDDEFGLSVSCNQLFIIDPKIESKEKVMTTRKRNNIKGTKSKMNSVLSKF